MKQIHDKCHLVISGNKINDATVKIRNSEITESTSEKIAWHHF